MKQSEAIGTITRMTINLEELSKYELQARELDLASRNLEHQRLLDLKSFLSKITAKEFAVISGRKATIRFTHQQTIF